MRKLSIIALVVILAGALSVVGFAAKDTATADASFSVDSAISLSIKKGSVVDFGAVTPGQSYEEKNATMLNVTANKNLGWTLESKKSSETPAAISALSVKLGTSDGEGSSNNIKVDYGLDVPENMPTGNHTVTVTFTASTK